jgi:Asp-tRNA(Asn)/Glu-tRNA(Gln) amidotransferase A subunit family amidase
LLERVSNLEHAPLVAVAANDLDTDGQSSRRKSTGHGDRGVRHEGHIPGSARTHWWACSGTGRADAPRAAFPALRFAANHPQNAPLVRERPEWVKDTIKYEVAEAERLTGADLGRAMARQTRMYDQSRQFFELYDYFVLPVTQVAPFDVNVPYPTQIAGTAMATYLDWTVGCYVKA